MENLLPDPLQAAGLLVWFIVMYAILKAWLFEPYLDMLDRRFADTGGAADEFAKIKTDIAAAEASLKSRLDAARSEAQAGQEVVLKAANETANGIVLTAQQSAQAEIQKAQADVGAAKKSVLGELEKAVAPLADSAISRLTGAAA